MATIWAIFEKRKIKININLAYYESYARPDDDVWWCMLPKKCLLLIRLKSYLPKVCTKRAEVSFWHGFKHLQSRSRGMSVVRRSWFVYSPRETTRLTNHADDFANVNSHACQKKNLCSSAVNVWVVKTLLASRGLFSLEKYIQGVEASGSLCYRRRGNEASIPLGNTRLFFWLGEVQGCQRFRTTWILPLKGFWKW